MTNNMQDTVCLILVAGYPVIAAILLYHHLKLKSDAKKTRKKSQETLLHSKPRRRKTVKTAGTGDQLPENFKPNTTENGTQDLPGL